MLEASNMGWGDDRRGILLDGWDVQLVGIVHCTKANRLRVVLCMEKKKRIDSPFKGFSVYIVHTIASKPKNQFLLDATHVNKLPSRVSSMETV